MSPHGPDAVICEPVRTPVGRFGGSLSNIPAHRLAAIAVRGLLARTELQATDIDDVIMGQCYPTMEAPALGRVAALDAGLPADIPGVQVDRRCGSGLQAVIYAAMMVTTGAADLVLAGGAENMSQAPYYAHQPRGRAWGAEVTLYDSLARGRVTAGGVHHPVPGGVIETAENLRQSYSIPRRAQDELALRSHRRSVSAQRDGRFADELISVPLTENGEACVDKDEHPRADTTLEDLAKLRPVRLSVDPGATVTAGNASGQNDGAAVCIVTTPDVAMRLSLRPLARLVGWAVAGVPPETMGIGPVPATARVLERSGLKLTDIDLIEVNEAFAAQVLACAMEWGFGDSDFDRVNVNGSGISLGHPVGATGARILATMLREMDRRCVRYGLETMCIGGGQGLAALFERFV
jgi:acetyl-CoA C-acetyltransferase